MSAEQQARDMLERLEHPRAQELSAGDLVELASLIAEHARLLAKEPPLLQCVDCKNTESPAGAMARRFNHGRCMHCGGYFKVIRA